MAVPGTMGKILLVDLDTGAISEEKPEDELYLRYLGGYGLGAYYLYRLQKPGVDPLGPDNHLGFFSGLLTGTTAITGNRYVVVAKSPKTGTWGDANSGGTFGPAMKSAGFDAVVFRGISRTPVLLLLRDGQAELRPADEWWGLDCCEVEEKAREEFGKDACAACIGPAGEKLSLLSCIINDRGRAAARSGLGAVMGSKRVKTIVALGSAKPAMADPAGMKQAIAKHREHLNQHPVTQHFRQYGTSGGTANCCVTGDSPIKNWAGVPDDFPTVHKISDDAVLAIERKKFGCWRCPIACGGETVVEEGSYASCTHKPEYETLGAFGTLSLNDNLESVNLCNETCNRYGLDTISVGCTVAFAIECFENGLVTPEETGGIELRWGDHEAIVQLTRSIARREGFGEVLADGVKLAAKRIGKGAAQYAVEVQGEEVAMHDPRLNPGLATAYQIDATPGRHTQMGSWTVEGGFAPEGLVTDPIERYTYSGKGRAHRIVSGHQHVTASAGMCMMAWVVLKPEALTDSLTYTTGHQYTHDEVLEMGDRIAALRMAFNIREGVRNTDFVLPGRMVGSPPLESGPLAGVTVDVETQLREYLEEIGWDTRTGAPTEETLMKLGLDFVAADFYPDESVLDT